MFGFLFRKGFGVKVVVSLWERRFNCLFVRKWFLFGGVGICYMSVFLGECGVLGEEEV